jgi:hypothetical protein
VGVALLIQRACAIFIGIRGLSGSTTFFKIISQTARFSGEKVMEHKTYVLIFSTTFV